MARDILGLGGPDANEKNLESTTTADSPLTEEEARRRRRMSDGADELTSRSGTAYRRSDGASGVDMGAGGEGTDIE